jgi:hypothetical protein
VRGLENALSSDERVKKLVDLWITGYSEKSKGGGGGGFVRAVRNSPKLKGLLKEKQATLLDGALTKMMNFRFAPQRFNTIMECATLVLENIAPIFGLLLELRCAGSSNEDVRWSTRLLETCFQPQNLLLLALVAELSSVACAYAHKFDNVAGPSKRASRIVRTAYWLDMFEKQVGKLFSFRDSEGRPQEPLVLCSHYSCGFVQRLRRAWDFVNASAVLSEGSLLFYQAGAGGEPELRRWVAEELGSMENITKVLLQGMHSEADNLVAASLQPFDLEWWASRPDESLPYPERFGIEHLGSRFVALVGRFIGMRAFGGGQSSLSRWRHA